jgi:hypothetical protein
MLLGSGLDIVFNHQRGHNLGVTTWGSKPGSPNLFPVSQNLHKGHIYGSIQTKFGINLRNTTGEVLGGQFFNITPWSNLFLLGQTCIEVRFMDQIRTKFSMGKDNYLISSGQHQW